NRVRYPTDRPFASSCSPRRFGPTQLPSATELWHTPTRTFTVLMWHHHRRTHSRANGNPDFVVQSFNVTWMPAFAGMTALLPLLPSRNAFIRLDVDATHFTHHFHSDQFDALLGVLRRPFTD